MANILESLTAAACTYFQIMCPGSTPDPAETAERMQKKVIPLAQVDEVTWKKRVDFGMLTRTFSKDELMKKSFVDPVALPEGATVEDCWKVGSIQSSIPPSKDNPTAVQLGIAGKQPVAIELACVTKKGNGPITTVAEFICDETQCGQEVRAPK